MHVVNITWFTDSMRERRPVAVETRHLIQVGAFMKKTKTKTFVLGLALDVSARQTLLRNFNNAKCNILVDTTMSCAEITAWGSYHQVFSSLHINKFTLIQSKANRFT